MIGVSENDGTVVLEMQGDFTDAVMDELGGLIGELVDRRKVKVVLGVKRVSWVTLKGIKWLAGNLRKLRQRDGDMRLAGLSPHWTSLLELTENQNLFAIYPSVEEAVASYRTRPGVSVPTGAGLVPSAAG